MERETILGKIKKAIQDADTGAEVILFGSQARGDFHAESDWDILILTDEKVDYDYRKKIAHETLKAELELEICLGMVIWNKTAWGEMALTPFFQEVEQEGRLIV